MGAAILPCVCMCVPDSHCSEESPFRRGITGRMAECGKERTHKGNPRNLWGLQRRTRSYFLRSFSYCFVIRSFVCALHLSLFQKKIKLFLGKGNVRHHFGTGEKRMEREDLVRTVDHSCSCNMLTGWPTGHPAFRNGHPVMRLWPCCWKPGRNRFEPYFVIHCLLRKGVML